MEPPVSEPSAQGAIPAATAAPEPLEEPPVKWPRRHGLCGVPSESLRPVGSKAYSTVCSLPSEKEPASRSNSTTRASRSGIQPTSTLEPLVVTTPFVQ